MQGFILGVLMFLLLLLDFSAHTTTLSWLLSLIVKFEFKKCGSSNFVTESVYHCGTILMTTSKEERLSSLPAHSHFVMLLLGLRPSITVGAMQWSTAVSHGRRGERENPGFRCTMQRPAHYTFYQLRNSTNSWVQTWQALENLPSPDYKNKLLARLVWLFGLLIVHVHLGMSFCIFYIKYLGIFK